MNAVYRFALPTLVLLTFSTRSSAGEETANEAPQAPEIHWHQEYGPAVKAAKTAQGMLLIHFRDGSAGEPQRAVDQMIYEDPQVQSPLSKFTCCKLSRDEQVTVAGKEIKLLSHAAFAELQNNAGLAILDYRDKDDPLFGHVVSVFPLARRKLDREKLLVLLDLPPGTLTQRTLIFAVRIHPERPASTTGEFVSLLANESADHSQYQANIRVQGHHHWDRRFHRINRRLARRHAGARGLRRKLAGPGPV